MRLIDADEQKSQLYEATLVNEDMDCLDFLKIVSLIDAQPTVYDMDKVVTELDEYLTKIVGRKSALYQTIMQIVKRGGKNEAN